MAETLVAIGKCLYRQKKPNVYEFSNKIDNMAEAEVFAKYAP